MEKKYFDPKDLRKFKDIKEHQPAFGDKFFSWYNEVVNGDTALTEREKALIALAVSHAIQCPYCIDAYTSSSLERGADEAQMMEAVHVSAAIRSGSSLVHGVQMMNKAKKKAMLKEQAEHATRQAQRKFNGTANRGGVKFYG